MTGRSECSLKVIIVSSYNGVITGVDSDLYRLQQVVVGEHIHCIRHKVVVEEENVKHYDKYSFSPHAALSIRRILELIQKGVSLFHLLGRLELDLLPNYMQTPLFII